MEDAELERLPGHEQHADPREHDEGDHEDLQEHEQDRHPKIGDGPLDAGDQDLDPTGDVRGLSGRHGATIRSLMSAENATYASGTFTASTYLMPVRDR